MCPPSCTCKAHAAYCSDTGVNLHKLPMNITLLYLLNTTSATMDPYNDTHVTYLTELLVFNMSNSQVPLAILHKFITLLPNLRVLWMRNSGVTNLGRRIFRHLLKLHIIDLQANFIHSLTTECMFGLVNVLELDFHNMSIQYIQPKSFIGMNSLVLLNLSCNDLEILNENLFNDLPSLIQVDLTHNVFTDIHVSTFYGLSITVDVSSSTECCYMGNYAACKTDNSR